MQLWACRVTRPVPGTDDEVYARQLVLMQAEGLANDSTQTVALDAAAGDTHRYGESETRPALVIPISSHAEESIAKPLPARIGRFEVRLATQALLRGESQPYWGRAVSGQVS